MPTLFERIAANAGLMHARRTYRRFTRAAGQADRVQAEVLRRLIGRNADSDFGRRHGLSRVRNADDFRRAVPLRDYEAFRPFVERVMEGEASALLGGGQRVEMFATSSGTTAAPKYIPVTADFVADYRRGWNTFGHKVLADHPAAILRAILQSSARHDERRTPAGVPCGAITGLLARSQKRIVRQFYVAGPEIAQIEDAAARYYVLMRLAIGRDLGFAVTANPATLIRLARIADEQSETLIRDIREGGISAAILPDAPLRRRLAARLRPDAARARELEAIRRRYRVLRPRDYWSPGFLACWTGGSMGHYLPTLREWFGDVPVRDIGLLASEGRVTVAVDDGTPAGVLDVRAGYFEFIPVERLDGAGGGAWTQADSLCHTWADSLCRTEDGHAETQAHSPWHTGRASGDGRGRSECDVETVDAQALEVGQDYAVVLSNASGLMRYRLDDVVRMRGWFGRAPLLEFLYRAGGVASMAGEKLTERQVVQAMAEACAELQWPVGEFVVAARWGDPPGYRLYRERRTDGPRTSSADAAAAEAAEALDVAEALDRALCRANPEYESKRASLRLAAVECSLLPRGAVACMDARLIARRGGRPEQYKRPCLLCRPGEDAALIPESHAVESAA